MALQLVLDTQFNRKYVPIHESEKYCHSAADFLFDGSARMTAIKTILWIQLALSLVGGYVAFTGVHRGAMSIAWTHGYKVELEKARQSPDFREPPEIRGQSFDRVIESMESSARARGDVAFYWLLTCGAAAGFAALLLWILRRVDQKSYAQKAV